MQHPHAGRRACNIAVQLHGHVTHTDGGGRVIRVAAETVAAAFTAPGGGRPGDVVDGGDFRSGFVDQASRLLRAPSKPRGHVLYPTRPAPGRNPNTGRQ